jgi:hypothetical protein
MLSAASRKKYPTHRLARRGSIVQVATPEEIVVMAQERSNDVEQKA